MICTGRTTRSIGKPYEDFIYYTECKGLKGYEEEAEKCLAKIRDNARNCKFEENRKILEGFVDQSQ